MVSFAAVSRSAHFNYICVWPQIAPISNQIKTSAECITLLNVLGKTANPDLVSGGEVFH